jgi:hypothetical protein
MGFATSDSVAARYRLDRDFTHELLFDFEASGWVTRSAFANSTRWSLTDRGRAENERILGQELDVVGARDAVTVVHAQFVPLNRRFGKACTNWQIRPARLDSMAFNDHTDWLWDEQVLRTLTTLGRAFGVVCDELTQRFRRFDGYATRYSAALAKVDAGQRRWVDFPELDSCHTVWIQFHEDLLATLGLHRGSDT